jgi:hypothetical protein
MRKSFFLSSSHLIPHPLPMILVLMKNPVCPVRGDNDRTTSFVLASPPTVRLGSVREELPRAIASAVTGDGGDQTWEKDSRGVGWGVPLILGYMVISLSVQRRGTDRFSWSG